MMRNSICFATLVLMSSPALADASGQFLIELDRKFAAEAQKIGVREAFSKYSAETVIGSGAGRTWGVPYSREDYAAQFGPGDHLDWVPEDGVAIADIGYNWGHWWSDVRGAEGKVTRVTGRYFNVWRRQQDGSWKLVADLGHVDPRRP